MRVELLKWSANLAVQTSSVVCDSSTQEKSNTEAHFLLLFILSTFATMDAINGQVFSALGTHSSIRILGDLPTKLLNSEDYLGSVSSMIEEFVATWKKTTLTRLLAVEVYPRHTYFALDLNNDKYDYQTAHEDMTVLPVYLLRCSSRSRSWSIVRYRRQDVSLAHRLAVLHNANGQAPLPFLEDHHTIIMHFNPRTDGRRYHSLDQDIVTRSTSDELGDGSVVETPKEEAKEDQ